MTHRLILGIDPGQSGAIALLADGQFDAFIDMPTMPRAAGGLCIDDERLAEQLRAALARHPGADRLAVLESVSAMPKQGSSSTFRFGESFGVVKGVLGTLRIPRVLVQPTRWKIDLGLAQRTLPGQGEKLDDIQKQHRQRERKEQARAHAIARFPKAATQLQRVKDQGRGDALLLAHWGHVTEAVAPARAAA